MHVLGFTSAVTAVCYLLDGVIAVGMESGEVKLMNIEQNSEVANILHGGSVVKLRVLEGKMYSISMDHTLRIHKISYV